MEFGDSRNELCILPGCRLKRWCEPGDYSPGLGPTGAPQLGAAGREAMATDLRSFGGTSPAAVEAFERRNGLALPEDYRGFLIKHNGALVGPAACFVNGPDQEVLVQVLLGLGREADFDLQGWLDEYRDEMPAGFLIVAVGAGTMLFILGAGAAGGGVYCWDHAHAFEGSSEEDGNTYWVAATFAGFVDALVAVR